VTGVPILDDRLGNRRDDETLARRVDRRRDRVETVVLDADQRRRSRFRARTEAGTEIGVVAGDDPLRPGDVLAGDGLTVVVELAGREAVVLDCDGVEAGGEALAAAAALGHRIGTRHRDLTTRGAEVLIAVGDDDPGRVREHVRRAGGSLPGVRIRTETVEPSLFDAARTPDHGHAHAHDHEHDHDHDHGTADGGDGA